jgi:membrane fusion protein, multidrug efflux system
MKNIFFKSIKAAIVLSFAVLCSCTQKTLTTGNDSSVNVKIETVEVSNDVNTLDYVGTIEEKSSTALGFSTLGTIEKIYVSEGEYVSGGKLLAKLDPTSAQSILDAAESTLKQAQDGYNRLKSIHDNGSLPEIQMVDIETKLQQAQSSYNIAKKNLKNCSLYAPTSGIVGEKIAQAGESAILGKSILNLLDISSVKVIISVPENEISAIPNNSKSKITITALGGKEYIGTGIEKSVSSNALSHTYRAYINLSNPKQELLPGMVCKVRISTGNTSQEIVIPINSIQTTSDGRKFVWGENKGTAKRMFITTGIAKGNKVVVTNGLSTGDRIITEGYQKISEDSKINVK